jgi:hypothetical protein
MDALSSAVGLKVDFDMALSEIARNFTVPSRGACEATRMPGRDTSFATSLMPRPM